MRYLVNILQAVDVRAAVEVAMLLALPTVLCLLIWFKSPWVKSFGRVLATIGLLSLFGWAAVAIGALTGPMPDNGFAIVCALLFGWAFERLKCGRIGALVNTGQNVSMALFMCKYVKTVKWWILGQMHQSISALA